MDGIHSVPMTGRQLRKIRSRLGWSQATLGRRLGVTENTAARWERGEVGISGPAARLTCVLFGWAERERAGDRESAAERRAIRRLERLVGKRALVWWEEK